MKRLNPFEGILRLLSMALLLLTMFGAMAVRESPAAEVAIRGYDTVAYFQADKALKGSESYAFQWHNLTWYFQTGENKDLFVARPEKYAPQYDGYCAWAMTEARKSQSDPEVWKMVEGKLYLNCSKTAFEKWSKDVPGNIKKADGNWLKFSGGN
jgi:hypothetical protein